MTDEKRNTTSFAEMMAHENTGFARLQPGEKVRVKVVKIGREWVFVDTGRKGEGVVDVREVMDAQGRPMVREGEMIDAFFRESAGGELRFSVRLGKGAGADLSAYEDAYHSRIPVEGVVQREIKGGYEVMLGGSVRAFCPYSQMSLHRTEPSVWINTRTTFHIVQFEEKGRNIVLSRRQIEEEQQAEQRARLAETLKPGMVVTGVVTSIRDFGAFVDFGGADGLVPKSEISYDPKADIHQLLAVGQSLPVRILELDFHRNKHLLSIKQVGPDPWENIVDRFPAGTHVTGRVSRLAPFGAFIRLADGVDGLMHISAMKLGKRIGHPKEVLSEGDEVPVVVEEVNPDTKRISLSWDREPPVPENAPPAEPEAPSWNEIKSRFQESGDSSMGLFGQLLQKKLSESPSSPRNRKK